jgi:hypothetical protein
VDQRHTPGNHRVAWGRGIGPDMRSLQLGNSPEGKVMYFGEVGEEGIEVQPNWVAASDGSGGPYTRDARVRRVGWAWCVYDDKGNFVGGASGGVPDIGEQTVHLAELFGAIHCIEMCEGSFELHVDNLNVVKGLENSGKDGNPRPTPKMGYLANPGQLEGPRFPRANRHAKISRPTSRRNKPRPGVPTRLPGRPTKKPTRWPTRRRPVCKYGNPTSRPCTDSTRAWESLSAGSSRCTSGSSKTKPIGEREPR